MIHDAFDATSERISGVIEKLPNISDAKGFLNPVDSILDQADGTDVNQVKSDD